MSRQWKGFDFSREKFACPHCNGKFDPFEHPELWEGERICRGCMREHHPTEDLDIWDPEGIF